MQQAVLDTGPMIHLRRETVAPTAPAEIVEGADSKQLIFMALPCRPEEYPKNGEYTIPAKISSRGGIDFSLLSSSLLNYGFNRLWRMALNARTERTITHFAMLHSDIKPCDNWADILIDEMDKAGADICSAVVPIKEERGLTSTGYREARLCSTKRITMKEVFDLPVTFDYSDIAKAGIDKDPQPNRFLAFNTGCWVCRFDRPWIYHFTGFQSYDAIIRRPDGMFDAACDPEDWMFSAWCGEKKVKAVATRAVPLGHWGHGKEYRNDSVWGTCATDPGDNPR